MSYCVSDAEHHVRCLRVFAVLLQRGEKVEWENYGWNPERDVFRLTVRTDERLFWQTFKELHPD
jgi:hypothetical protein